MSLCTLKAVLLLYLNYSDENLANLILQIATANSGPRSLVKFRLLVILFQRALHKCFPWLSSSKYPPTPLVNILLMVGPTSDLATIQQSEIFQTSLIGIMTCSTSNVIYKLCKILLLKGLSSPASTCFKSTSRTAKL